MADATFEVEHSFTYPPRRVWRLWTEPELMASWWGIDGARSVVRELDVRVGGRWSIDMHTPSGAVYPNTGAYLEVEPGARLVFTQTIGLGPGDSTEVRHEVTFEEQPDGSTRLQVRVVCPDARVRDALVQNGMANGMRQGLRKLETVLDAEPSA